MKIKAITLTAGRTFNLGNFESPRVDGSTTVELEDGDDIAAARTAALEEIRQQLRAQHTAFGPKAAA